MTAKTTFQFTPAKLRGILIFAAKQDIRYYLNGVYFRKAPNGKGMMAVATDGHRLTVIYHEQDVSGIADDFSVIVPREELEQAAKTPAKGAPGLVLDIAFSVERTACVVNGVTLNPVIVTMKSAVTVQAQEVEGKFPDFARVIPSFKDRVQSVIACNASYLADYHKLAQALGKKHCAVTFSTNGDTQSVLVDIGDLDVLSVLMPMRGDATTVDRDWLAPGIAT